MPGYPEPFSFKNLEYIKENININICTITSENDGTGTGFLLKIYSSEKNNYFPVLITCYHVLKKDEKSLVKNITITFDNEKEKERVISIDKTRLIYKEEKIYDIVIIGIKKNDNLDTNNFLEIDEGIYKEGKLSEIYKNKTIYIIHYPENNDISISSGTIKSICDDNIKIQHRCSTKPGSSGSPLINFENHKVIGIHSGYDNHYNSNIGRVL